MTVRILKFICIGTTLGFLAYGNAMSADYAVGVVNPSVFGGTGVNLYSVTAKGVDLVQQYAFPEADYYGNTAAGPLTLAMDPAHDFVYIAYNGPGLFEDWANPILAAFTITSKGLVYQWQSEIETGDPTLQGTTLEAGPNYVIENTFPDAVDLWVEIYSKSGQHIVDDKGNGSGNASGLISGHISPSGKLYYSCRDVPTTEPVTPANTVVVYELSGTGLLDTSLSKPLATSTDPVFVANVCVPTPPRLADIGGWPLGIVMTHSSV